MQDGEPVDKLVAEILTLSSESTGPADLLLKSGERIREYISSVDNVYYKELAINTGLASVEEFAMNTGKPYVDNRLSDYSAFPELINYYNTGFRSCLILPIKAESRGLGIITMLSKQEDVFDVKAVETLGVLAGIISAVASMKIEKEKSLNVAKYFDAAFNTMSPQALCDKGGNIVKVNKSMMTFAGKTSKDFSGKSIGELFAITQENLDTIIIGKPVVIGSRLYPERSFRVTASRISEKLLHLLFEEITEVRELEEKAQFFDHGEEVFMLLDKDLRITWVSGNVERLLKADENAVVGKKLLDFAVDPDELKAEIMRNRELLFTKQTRLNMGNDVATDVKASLFRNATGYSCILGTDYEKKISSTLKAVDSLMQISGDVVIRLDRNGSIVGLNKAGEKILRYRNDEINGLSISSICADKESQGRVDSAIAFARKNGISTDMYVNLIQKGSNTTIPFEQGIMSITNQNGELSGYIISGKEQLTRMNLERLHEEMYKAESLMTRYKSESELKTQFIHNISHDLKTPITNIQGYSRLLMMQDEFGKLTDEQKGYLEIIINEGKRLMDLIQQILDVAKLESGKIKLDKQKVNLKDVVDNPSIRAFENYASSKGISFTINVDYNVPEVEADPNRLIQVFVNLIGNAMKFTEKGGVTVKIFRKGKEKSVRVEVIDTGIGIREEDTKKLFKKFFQLPHRGTTTRPEGAGTGLGLSIVSEIVRLHGGKKGVDSVYGKGSTFWFTIPIQVKKKRQQTEEEGQGM